MVENHKDKDCAFKEITLDLFRRWQTQHRQKTRMIEETMNRQTQCRQRRQHGPHRDATSRVNES